jgi:hypothetical protein
LFSGHCSFGIAGTVSSDRGGPEKPKLMQATPTPMATATIKRTMKRYAKAAVELAKAAVLLVLRTSEVVSSMAGTQSCKDFTRRSHIKNLNANKPYFRKQQHRSHIKIQEF